MNNPVYFLDPDGMLSQGFMDKIINSASGTTYTNNGNGTFSSNTSETIDNDGNTVDGNSSADANTSQDPPKGKKVLEEKKGFLSKLWFSLEPREWEETETGLVYQVNADGTIRHIRPLGGAGALGIVGGVGSGQSILKFRGLIQNLSLRGLTHQQLVRAFNGTGFTLSSHAIKRLKDIRTSNLGFNSLNDIKQIFNKGVSFDAGAGAVGKSYKGLEIIWNAETKVIITIRPAKIR
ncbi:hypothetical protein [Flavobacterium sp. C3NV]|uniref:hypothetical protein n=1 Tax=Flavobacterium sp. C3NV TaxID=3393358 RepID=UPI00399032E5